MSKKRCLENIEQDKKAVGVCIEDMKDRDKWRLGLGYLTPNN